MILAEWPAQVLQERGKEHCWMQSVSHSVGRTRTHVLAPCSTGLLMPGMPDALGLPNTGLLAAPGECTRRGAQRQ